MGKRKAAACQKIADMGKRKTAACQKIADMGKQKGSCMPGNVSIIADNGNTKGRRRHKRTQETQTDADNTRSEGNISGKINFGL